MTAPPDGCLPELLKRKAKRSSEASLEMWWDLKSWYMSKNNCDVFGPFSKLGACNVSVVASGVFSLCGQIISLAQKLSREAWGARNLCIFEKNGLLEMYLGVVGVFCIINCSL